ncbi:hypothetical protein C9374_004998 [Naegleria lovaniensis]|uniref:Translation elongation factor EFG/EF2 domain-containing protein n=1 Tax=Naegleria lovaniensis TaxID=51637 RepID=A0AA88KNW4_NAELO|nr:uncharacterized protein C9374_004998 [Naegleria lovaniensis]KAG2383031.1 hypothetical protein C9374_004998 [Naegleria lovaniensis]
MSSRRKAINFTTIALPFSESALDRVFISKLFSLSEEGTVLKSNVGYLCCDYQNYELNWIQAELHHYNCLEYLFKEPLFQVVDGLILLLDMNIHLHAVVLQQPNSFYTFVLEQILKIVQHHSLQFMIYLNGFENYSTILHPNHVDEFYLNLQRLSDKCGVSLDHIILGSVSLNVGGMPASRFKKLSQIYEKIELSQDHPQSERFTDGLLRKGPFRETLLKKITEILPESCNTQNGNNSSILNYFELPNESLSIMQKMVQNNVEKNKQDDNELILYAFSMIPHPETPRRYLSLCKVLCGKARPGILVTILMINSKGQTEKISKGIQNVAIRKVNSMPSKISVEDNNSSRFYYDHYLNHQEEKEFISHGSICLVAGLDNYILNHALIFTTNSSLNGTLIQHTPSTLENSKTPSIPKSISVHDGIDFAFECPLLLQYPQELSEYIMTEMIREMNTVSFRMHVNEYEEGTLSIQSTNLYLLYQLEKKLQQLFQELNISWRPLSNAQLNHASSDSSVATTMPSTQHSTLFKSSTSIATRETCAAKSPTLLIKSPNKHVRLFVRAEPLSEMDHLQLSLQDCPEGVYHAKKKLFKCHGNVLIEGTKHVQYVNEILDPLFRGFSLAMQQGVLCDSPVVNMKFYLEDATLVSDAIHRGAGQVIVAARRLFKACQLASQPRIIIAQLKVHVIGKHEEILKICNLLSIRHETNVTTMTEMNGWMSLKKCEMSDNHGSSPKQISPIQKQELFHISFIMLVDQYCEMIESHYDLFETIQHFTYVHSFEMVEGDATLEGTPGNQVLSRMRQMKGITSSLALDTYSDKL